MTTKRPRLPTYVVVGALLRGARLAAGLTQKELGARVGLTRGALYLIEEGTVATPLHRICELADAVALPVGVLWAALDKAFPLPALRDVKPDRPGLRLEGADGLGELELQAIAEVLAKYKGGVSHG